MIARSCAPNEPLFQFAQLLPSDTSSPNERMAKRFADHSIGNAPLGRLSLTEATSLWFVDLDLWVARKTYFMIELDLVSKLRGFQARRRTAFWPKIPTNKLAVTVPSSHAS